jgi:hypothetical protein
MCAHTSISTQKKPGTKRQIPEVGKTEAKILVIRENTLLFSKTTVIFPNISAP